MYGRGPKMSLPRSLPFLLLAASLLAAPAPGANQDPPGPASLPTSDFFAQDRDLTRAVARLAHAIESAESGDALEARSELDSSLDEFGRHILKARARGVGPLAEQGNAGLEARTSLAVLEAVALHRLDEHLVIRDKLRSLKRPKPRFESKDLVGIPIVERGDPTRRRIALTFDDGPERPHTREVLDVLQAQGVKATFFVVGKACKREPELLRRMYREGHELGQHSWDHPRLTRLSSKQIRDQVERTDAVFSQVIPELPPVSLFRLPFQIGIRSKLVQSVLAQRFDYLVDWTVDSRDYMAKSVEDILSNTLKQSQRNGAIVLYHDRRPYTAEAVNILIETLRPKGYEFVTVSEVMGTDPAGSRVDLLVQGLQAISRNQTRQAARILGNFTLRNPEAPGAPAALFSAYHLAHWLRRPKAEKLRAALGRRYSETLFGRLVRGELPEAPEFVPGGHREVPPPEKVELTPLEPAPVVQLDPEPLHTSALPQKPEVPPESSFLGTGDSTDAPLPSVRPPARTPGEVLRASRPRDARVPGIQTARDQGQVPPRVATAPQVPPGARVVGFVNASPAPVPVMVRKLSPGPTARSQELPTTPLPYSASKRSQRRHTLPPATPPPPPYEDPEPELDGSHMIDPDHL